MACYHPVPAYQAGPGAKLQLHPPVGFEGLQVPCGTCIGCLGARATAWAYRCEHEASMWTHNMFVTLTYDDKHLPKGGELSADDFTLFLKRLRKYVADSVGDDSVYSDRSSGVRFFGCGEYGEASGRPHYHSLLFNVWFADARACGKGLYQSPTVERLWGCGGVRIGTVTGASANYIAKYQLKTFGREWCDEDGVVMRKPFLRMSLKPGIGHRWLEQNVGDLKHGYLVHEGCKRFIPPAYKRKLKRWTKVLNAAGVVVDYQPHPLSDQVAYAAYAMAKDTRGDKATPPRLAAAEVIHKSRSLVSRSL